MCRARYFEHISVEKTRLATLEKLPSRYHINIVWSLSSISVLHLDLRFVTTMANRGGGSGAGGLWKPGTKREILVDDNNTATGSETSSVPFNFRSGPLSLQRQSLPISKHRRQILFAIEKFPVVVVVRSARHCLTFCFNASTIG